MDLNNHPVMITIEGLAKKTCLYAMKGAKLQILLGALLMDERISNEQADTINNELLTIMGDLDDLVKTIYPVVEVESDREALVKAALIDEGVIKDKLEECNIKFRDIAERLKKHLLMGGKS